MDLELAGKVALVTGATRGIGNALARRLGHEAARWGSAPAMAMRWRQRAASSRGWGSTPTASSPT
jgi:NAD(P)-dependent dehydrogenase (short-subunit alcohol dehydrogenase family)